jgi:hypothetical protein
MNKLVYGALAGTLLVSSSVASENEWLSLDQEIESLSSSLNQSGGGPEFSGWVFASWNFHQEVSPSTATFPATGDKAQYFLLDSVRIRVDGQVANYGYRIEYDFADPNSAGFGTTLAGLLDAYGYVTVADTVMFTVGNFRTPFLRSGLLDRNRLMFTNRSDLGFQFAARTTGLMASGTFETLDWYLSGQNGTDGLAKKYLFNGRLEWDILGGGVGMLEGAWGAPKELAWTIGGAIQDDGGVSDGLNWAADTELTVGGFYLQGEVVGFDEGTVATPGLLGSSILLAPQLGTLPGREDTTPWNVSASFLFNDMYEIAARYQNVDDTGDTTAWAVAINRYVLGHDIKWTAQWEQVETDTAIAPPGEDSFGVFSIGMGLSF